MTKITRGSSITGTALIISLVLKNVTPILHLVKNKQAGCHPAIQKNQAIISEILTHAIKHVLEIGEIRKLNSQAKARRA